PPPPGEPPPRRRPGVREGQPRRHRLRAGRHAAPGWGQGAEGGAMTTSSREHRGPAVFHNLRFAQRIWLGPGLAAVGLVVILVAAQVLGARTGAALTGIQQGYSPALETSR